MAKNEKKPGARFWEKKTLEQLSPEEWEMVCDHCGQCCLFKLEDEESRDIYLTNVVCRFLERKTGNCLVYSDRRQAVPTCIQLNPNNVVELNWIPLTCAYRLLAEGKPLPAWHPLIAGNKKMMNREGFFLGDEVVSETDVDMNDLENHVIS